MADLNVAPAPSQSRVLNRATIYRLVFAVLLAARILTVWVYPRFASQDGPSHLYNTAIISSLHAHSWHSLDDYYRLNTRLVPNLTTYFILLGLMKVAPPVIAEKILVSAYFIIFPLAFWWILRNLCGEADHFLVWGLALCNTWFIGMGFYNFSYGTVMFLLTVGYWLKHRLNFGLAAGLVLSFLATLLYFTHLYCFVMASLAIGAMSVAEALWGKAGTPRKPQFVSWARSIFSPQLSFLPVLFFRPFSNLGSQFESHPASRTLMQRLSPSRPFYILVQSRDLFGYSIVLITGIFVVLAVWRFVGRIKEGGSSTLYGLIAFSATCLAMYVFLPNSTSGGGNLPERAAWFGLWGVITCLTLGRWPEKEKLLIFVAAVAVVATGLISEVTWRHDVSPLLASYSDAARFVEPNKTLFSLCYCEPFNNPVPVLANLRISPLDHAGEITALAGRDFSLSNYEATGSSFPTEYQPSVNPGLHSTAMLDYGHAPEIADLAGYEAATHQSVDYVLLWGGPDVQASESVLDRQLRSGYMLIYTAQPPSLLRLFRKR